MSKNDIQNIHLKLETLLLLVIMEIMGSVNNDKK